MERRSAERETSEGGGQPAISRVLMGAGLIFVHGLFGAFLSAFLTALKFRSAYSCDVALLSSCQIGSAFNCESVLNSSWSTFPGDIPISIYATSFFLVVVGLSGTILLWPHHFSPAGRALLLVLAWCSIAVIVPLSVKALFLGLCSYCLVVYIISVIILLAASIMNSRGPRSAVDSLRDSTTHRRTSTLLITGLTFVAFTLVQIVWFLQERSSVQAEEQCMTQTGELPETSLVIGSESPEVDIALFVDLSCSVCRREYATWKQDVLASEGKYRLKVYHFPLGEECVDGLTTFSLKSEVNHSCAAARAVECIERQQKGLGLKLIERLFALQDADSGPFFSLQNLATAADDLGVHVDPGNPGDPFFKCIEDDEAVLRRIQGHARFAAREHFRETPAILFVFYQGDVPLNYAYRVTGEKNYEDIDQYIKSAYTISYVKQFGEEPSDE